VLLGRGRLGKIIWTYFVDSAYILSADDLSGNREIIYQGDIKTHVVIRKLSNPDLVIHLFFILISSFGVCHYIIVIYQCEFILF
jgi:hypothetical protein